MPSIGNPNDYEWLNGDQPVMPREMAIEFIVAGLTMNAKATADKYGMPMGEAALTGSQAALFGLGVTEEELVKAIASVATPLALDHREALKQIIEENEPDEGRRQELYEAMNLFPDKNED